MVLVLWGTKKVVSSNSIMGLRTLETTIGCHITPSNDDLKFSGVNCDVVGSYKGCSGQYINIKILDDKGFQRKRSAMTKQRKAGLSNNI